MIYIFLCLILTLISCNQNSRHKKTTNINIDTTNTKIEHEPRRESFKDGIDNLPNKLLQFVPDNYSVLDTAIGDLNLDGINDYVIVLNKNGEDTLSNVVNNPERRPLLIILCNQNNELYLARRNDNTVYCIDCGGMMGDPFEGITIKDGYFSIEHYGGSAWRWTRIITYKYSKQDQEWYLYKDGSESFHATKPGKVESKIETTKDFGKVNFQNYDIYK